MKKFITATFAFTFLLLSSMNASFAQSDTKHNKHISQAAGLGVIKSISRLKKTITIKHERIEKINWPAMTMPFKVEKNINVSDVKIGAKIMFYIRMDDNHKYRIYNIEYVK